MSDFKSYRKADLAKAAAKVGISVRSKDTKQSLLEKIERFLEESPEKAKDLVVFDDEDDAMEVVTLVDENDVTEEEDEDDEDDAEHTAKGFAASAGDEEDDEDDDESDRDYNAPPPINLREWILDPVIAAVESAHNKLLLFTDQIGVTTLDCNEELRATLSTTVALNVLEAAAEASYFLYYHVPLVPVRLNPSVPQVLRDNIPRLNSCTCSVPDVASLISTDVISVLGNWMFYAVVSPLLISYYVNFSRRVVQFEADEHSDEDDEDGNEEVGHEEEEVYEDDDEEDEESFSGDFSVVIRAYKFDPFIFALSKALIYYFIQKNGAIVSADSHSGMIYTFKNLVLFHLDAYHSFVTNLGNFPLILGLANVVIGLYSQFEDY